MENNTITPSDPIPEASHDQGNSDKPSAGNLSGLILSFFQQAKENKRLMNSLRITLRSLIAVLVALFVFVFVLYFVPGFQELSSGGKTRLTSDPELKNDQNYKKQICTLSRDIQRLSKKYSSYTSGQSYIVINTTDNRFFLYRNKKLIREGFCSSGSYTMLTD